MKINQIIVSTLLLTATITFAQNPNYVANTNNAPIKQRAEQRINNLTSKLQLTPTQQVSAKTIFAKEATAIRALHQDKTTPRDQRREKMEQIRKATQTEFENILTPEQKTIFATLKKPQHDVHANHTQVPTPAK